MRGGQAIAPGYPHKPRQMTSAPADVSSIVEFLVHLPLLGINLDNCCCSVFSAGGARRKLLAGLLWRELLSAWRAPPELSERSLSTRANSLSSFVSNYKQSISDSMEQISSFRFGNRARLTRSGAMRRLRTHSESMPRSSHKIQSRP
jgi:hypothetical protein